MTFRCRFTQCAERSLGVTSKLCNFCLKMVFVVLRSNAPPNVSFVVIDILVRSCFPWVKKNYGHLMFGLGDNVSFWFLCTSSMSSHLAFILQYCDVMFICICKLTSSTANVINFRLQICKFICNILFLTITSF